jgi:hypothetical protein
MMTQPIPPAMSATTKIIQMSRAAARERLWSEIGRRGGLLLRVGLATLILPKDGWLF